MSNLNQNIGFTMEEENNGELELFYPLLKLNNVKMSPLVYRKPTHYGQYLH